MLTKTLAAELASLWHIRKLAGEIACVDWWQRSSNGRG